MQKMNMVEQLEARRLLYGSFVLDGILYVDGDMFNDVIRVYAEPGSALMTVEVSTQQTLYFPLESFHSVEINGFDGDDLIYAEHNNYVTGKLFMIYGHNGNDTIYGSTGQDFIRGQRGNDLIYGRGGNDTIYGDDGNDTIYGDDGDDVIYGGWGGDLIFGGSGNDTIRSGLGRDTIHGEAGDDELYAGNGMDVVYGGDGHDYIEGRGKDDVLYGGAGNDTIIGGAGNDFISGDDGDDELWAEGYNMPGSPLFLDTLNGGAGIDRWEADFNDTLIDVEIRILG